MTDNSGFHGLPADYSTPAGESEGWASTMAYLQSLETSGRPIVLAIANPRWRELDEASGGIWLTRQVGFLRRLPDREDRTTMHRFAVNWPDPAQSCGEFYLDERVFERAQLRTNDGDDYFRLELDLGAVSVLLMDANANMDGATREWRERYRQTYYDLPAASEIEEKWRAEPNREQLRTIKQHLAQLRADLVKRGATAAEGMSDAELEAASHRVAWGLRTSGRMSDVDREEWPALYLEEFARNLREGAG